jgi:hypothetical protein
METKIVQYHGAIIHREIRMLIKSLLIERDGENCHKCMTKKANEIHHLRYTEYPTLDDIVMLCHDCHIDITVEGRGFKRRKGMTKAQARAAQRREAKKRLGDTC